MVPSARALSWPPSSGARIRCSPDTPISTPATSSPRMAGRRKRTISSASARAANRMTMKRPTSIRVSAASI